MALQRFCPLCDRAFVESEALLVCEGCSVMYHPSCWVRNDGCATPEPHEVRSRAIAYRLAEPGVSSVPQPAESLRPQRSPESTARVDDGAALIGGAAVAPAHRDGIEALDAGNAAVPGPFQPPPRPEGHSNAATHEREPAAPPRLASRPLEPPGAPVRHGRYVPPDEEFVTIRKPMPGIYKERRWLQYWYIPVAAAIAVLVAGGVVYGANLLFGGGDDDGENNQTVFEATPTATATLPRTTAANTTETTATTSATTGPSTTTTATAIPTAAPTGGKFQIADVLVVTGAGDCLNVRVAPDRLQPAIVCLKDGAEVGVTGGPQQADSFTWWQVITALGEGWAVEDFLAKKP